MAEQKTSNKITCCKQCTKSIDRGTSCVVCEGFCSDAFHAECAKLSIDELLLYRKLPNVYWMCNECSNVMRDMRKDRTLPAKRTEITAIPSISSAAIDRHDKDIAELQKQINAIHQTLSNVSTSCTAPGLQTVNESRPLAQSSPLSSSKLLCGTKNVGDQSCSSDESGVFEGDKFWLFFTRIKNTATERDISEMVADSLGTDETTVVKKLVSPWKATSLLPYVSFKVGINVRFKEPAMRQSTWPAGICFREFRNNVWEPARRSMS